jgi:hypothetical protein
MKIVAMHKPTDLNPFPNPIPIPIPFPQNPCECAEERSFKRIRASDCLSEASSSSTPLEARFYVASQPIFTVIGAFCPTRAASNGWPDFHTAKAIRSSLRAITTSAAVVGRPRLFKAS